MRIFVQVGCEIDPDLNVRIDRMTGGAQAEPGDTLLRVGPAGRAAVDLALAIPGAVVTAYAVGEGHREALRHALAAGVEQAVEVVGDVTDWFRAQEVDLVIADTSAGRIAARNHWAHLAGLTSVEIREGRLYGIRALGKGDREEVEARLPAAIRIADTVALSYIARARLNAVDDARIEVAVLGDTSAGIGTLQIARPRTRAQGASAAPSQPAKASDRLAALMGGMASKKTAPVEKKEASVEDLAEELVRYLAHHDLLEER
jgi:electron transfer flavoprotein alpha/beta subunit